MYLLTGVFPDLICLLQPWDSVPQQAETWESWSEQRHGYLGHAGVRPNLFPKSGLQRSSSASRVIPSGRPFGRERHPQDIPSELASYIPCHRTGVAKNFRTQNVSRDCRQSWKWEVYGFLAEANGNALTAFSHSAREGTSNPLTYCDYLNIFIIVNKGMVPSAICEKNTHEWIFQQNVQFG